MDAALWNFSRSKTIRTNDFKGPIMIHLIDKLKNLFTAMAYAEAGDFDAVKQILREQSDKLEPGEGKEYSHHPAVPAM
jgi:hypothetical protein